MATKAKLIGCVEPASERGIINITLTCPKYGRFQFPIAKDADCVELFEEVPPEPKPVAPDDRPVDELDLQTATAEQLRDYCDRNSIFYDGRWGAARLVEAINGSATSVTPAPTDRESET